MSRRILPPDIDDRTATELFRALREMAPHYTKEWSAKDDDDPGVALLKIYSFIAEGVISRLNRAPERNFLAFLDLLGIRLLQARPARVPVRFLVATGIEDPFIVDQGTQVSAPPTEQRTEDLPFETLTKLLAIPSNLTALVAVDPEADRIFQPPPGFLQLEKAATPAPALTVQAFSSVNSNTLQLDPPDQVKKGDFLRIDRRVIERTGPEQCVPITDNKESTESEHLVVADVKGTVVTLTDLLKRDYTEGTTVRKVTQFELFEAKNWQEHILYLAHKEYFAVRSEAQIIIRVQHAPGVSSNLQSFKVVWEFFGKLEALKDEPEKWQQFEVDADATQGLTRDGEVLLTKPAGEITETEIDGKKTRWIRARLDQPLPATSLILVPKIELINFAVSSSGKNLPPDKAFHNDTPLTTDVEFLPFGTEPRIFDRFSIASEEAFSKPGAEVVLDVKLDTTELLAAPGAVRSGNQVRVFARGVGGRLLEFNIDPRGSNLATEKHDSPPNTRISPPDPRLMRQATPAVVQNGLEDLVGAFVFAEDGKVWLRLLPGPDKANWHWYPLLSTPGELQFDPAAVFLNNHWGLFVVADGRLYIQDLDLGNLDLSRSWIPALGAPTITSSPFVLEVAGGVIALVTDNNGHTWTWDPLKAVPWTDVTPQIAGSPNPDFLAAPNARPCAVVNGSQLRIFVRNAQDKIVAIDSATATGTNLGSPPQTNIDSNPFAVDIAGDRRVYARATDNSLWTFEDPAGPWISLGRPSGVNLQFDPIALLFPKVGAEIVEILSTSDKNSLLEFRARGTTLDDGALQAGPKDFAIIQDDLSSLTSPLFIHITDGPNRDAVRKLDMTLSVDFFAVFESSLDEPVDKDTGYEILEEKNTGQVKSATSTELEMQTGIGALVINDDYLLVGDQIRRIVNGSVVGDTVTVDPPWVPVPSTTDDYHLLRPQAAKKITTNSALLAVLSAAASTVNDAYKDAFVEITDGPGESPGSRKIIAYSGATQNVELETAFDKNNLPEIGSKYVVSSTRAEQAWFKYEDPDQEDIRPALSWEYFNGNGWLALLVNDGTDNFLTPGVVKFNLPDDIQKTEVAGQESFWIRARIVGGDFGRELFTFDQTTGQVKIEKDPIRPPRILELGISYKVTELKNPQFCLALNNLNYLDQTAANFTPNKNFQPFLPLSDDNKALYFGFDRSFSGAPVKIYFAAKELPVDERNKPKLAWSFAYENDWKEILVDDETEAFTSPDFVTMNVPDGFQDSQKFGQGLYWIRATLTEGQWSSSPLFSGVFLNTVEARQVRTIRDEIIGSSTSLKNQKFKFQQTPIIEGEVVRVREALTEEERKQLVLARGEDAVLEIRDQQDRVLQTWIRWIEVPEFFDSDGTSRHYRLDRHTGEIEFGDGVHGRIPPAGGDNIVAFTYQAGGGLAGNVKAGEINTPVTAVAGVDSVINPVAAGGGSDAVTNDDMLTIGPAQISHRERAVTPDDFEKLALEASREVRKARCRPNRNANGMHELGWTTVHIVPDSLDATPVPSLGLRRAVQRYLAERADVTVVDQKHIFIGPPEYVPVTVEATIFAKSLDVVASAEQKVKRELETFLHPLRGGPEKEGWEFGRDLAASDLYAVLEAIDEVDYVSSLQLFSGNVSSGEQVAVAPDALIASGTHRITTTVSTE